MQAETESFSLKIFYGKYMRQKRDKSLCRSGGREAQVLNFGLKWNPFNVENMVRTLILKTAHLSSETSITAEIIIS